jgi:hypothetical protein
MVDSEMMIWYLELQRDGFLFQYNKEIVLSMVFKL